VHHHLIDAGMRAGCGLIVETGEAREIHHFCCLLGYGASRRALAGPGHHRPVGRRRTAGDTDPQCGDLPLYQGAVNKGILKVLSKMGISTLQSYRGAQIFECVGLTGR
jgi:hypothetical protein